MDNSSKERCIQCRLIIQDCICRHISAFRAEHKITLLTSKKEERIISNTGRLLRWMLKNISTVYMGEKGWEKEVEWEITRSDYTPVILYPTPPVCDGHVIMEKTGKPLNIFVLDTSWKNARRWLHKPILMNLKKIGLKTAMTSEYCLRKHSGKNYLCTFQAVTAVMAELGTKDFASVSFQINEKFKLWVRSLARERGLIKKTTRT
ncbi:MAG: tRNA-uridine aminocarboxypropyltransferase [Candidatus Brocadiales bacterium]|nr:tRNA-uridine aminocarboxypropyltransferase [Candidatus Brocadiales bacterium]